MTLLIRLSIHIFSKFSSVIVVIMLLTICSCKQKNKRIIPFPKTDLTASSLIPLPLEIEATYSGFALDKFTVIKTSNDSDFEDVGAFLAFQLLLKTDLQIAVNKETENAETVISIQQLNEETNNPEAYTLQISNDSIILSASTAEGAFRGVQTLRQLIPEVSNDTLALHKIWVIPTGKIKDAPQFEYRGTMLDVARHFFSADDIKKYIDVLSYYKYNMLHLHLSDDQGWRIEIKSWPKLTEIGGSTEVGGGEGGFYTQEEYADIVKYAAKHYITILPEIDMPGHTNAASVSYPFLNGNGKTPKLYTRMKVGFSTLATRKDTVYTFIDDVVREIAALTPGPYFHIGGDESHVTKKDDYLYFINKVEKIVQKYGKRMIGWDDISVADIDSTSIAQWWRSEENVQEALEKDMQVILSPAEKAYLDMKYDKESKHGLTWAGYITTDSAYAWSPETFLPKERILGIEAPLWSETISTISELEYLAFPRAIGYAELGWTPLEQRNWETYKIRLANHAAYLKRTNVNYYHSPLVDWKTTQQTQKVTIYE